MAKKIREKINFRELKEGTLLKLVRGGQPVIFEGIEKTLGVADDIVKLICLDPIEGLGLREYYLRKKKIFLRSKAEYSDIKISSASEQGRKYLELITGK